MDRPLSGLRYPAALLLALACGAAPARAQCAFAMQFQVQMQFGMQNQPQMQMQQQMHMQMIQQRQMQHQMMLAQHLAMHQHHAIVHPLHLTQVHHLTALHQTNHLHLALHFHALHARQDLWLWPWHHGTHPGHIHPIHLTHHQSRLVASGHLHRVTHLHQVHHEHRVTLHRPGMERHATHVHHTTALRHRTVVREQRHLRVQKKTTVQRQDHRHLQARVQLRVSVNMNCGSCHVTSNNGPTVAAVRPRLPQIPFGIPPLDRPALVKAPPQLIPAVNPLRPQFPAVVPPGPLAGPVLPPGLGGGPAMVKQPPGPLAGPVLQPGPSGTPTLGKPTSLDSTLVRQPPDLPPLAQGPASSPSSLSGFPTRSTPEEPRISLPESSSLPGSTEYARPPDLPALEGTMTQLADLGSPSRTAARAEADEDSSPETEDVVLPPPLPPLPEAAMVQAPRAETVAQAQPAPSLAEAVLRPPPLPSLP